MQLFLTLTDLDAHVALAHPPETVASEVIESDEPAETITSVEKPEVSRCATLHASVLIPDTGLYRRGPSREQRRRYSRRV